MHLDGLRRRSRFHRQPGRTPQLRERKVLEIQTRDLAVFELLQRYRYLPINFIRALLPADLRGQSYKRFQERMGQLYHEGYLNRPNRQREAENARWRHLVYELDHRARIELRERGMNEAHRPGFGRNFRHELMVCLVQASIEIACNETPGLEYVSWRHILQHAATPESTKTSKRPFRIPVVLDGVHTAIAPDGWPSGIRYSSPSGGRYALCFPGHETDCATEPLAPSDVLARANIECKLRAYLAIYERRTHQMHFGFPNMIVPFVTTSRKRMGNMMALLAKITGGKGSSFLLFKCMPQFASMGASPEPTANFLSEPWERVGHPPLELIAELHAGAQNRGAA